MKRLSFFAMASTLLLLLGSAFPGAVFAATGPHQPHNKDECKNGGWQNFPNAGFRNQGDCVSFVSSGKFTCRDPLGCISYASNAPIRIAVAAALTGGAAALGADERDAVLLALSQHGNLYGHPLAAISNDDSCSFDGGISAANAITADSTVAGVVGTTCSSSARAAAPIISAAGLDMISPSNTAPFLTDPATHAAGYLRTAWNDKNNPPVMAQFLFAQGARTSAVFFDGNPNLGGFVQAFADTFQALGGSNIALYDLSATDLDTALNELASTPPDVIYFASGDSDLAMAIVNDTRDRSTLETTKLATDDIQFSQDFTDSLGSNAEGMYFGVPDDAFTGSAAYANFSSSYFTAFGTQPQQFGPYAFDATNVILAAIENTAISDSKGTLYVGRQALRNAMFATSDLQGLTGTLTCNPYGECGATTFKVMQVQGGAFVQVGP